MTMNADTASDEVTDLIVSVEVNRREIQKDSGMEAARNFALRKLREALEGEQNELQAQGSSPVRTANINVLSAEIRRVEAMANAPSQRPAQGAAQAPHGRGPRNSGAQQPGPGRNRGRRSMGRRSGR